MVEILLVALLVVVMVGIALAIGYATTGERVSANAAMDKARLERDNERLRQEVAMRVEHNALLAEAYLDGARRAVDRLAQQEPVKFVKRQLEMDIDDN